MKIGVNLSFIVNHTNFGIGTYIVNILSGLQELGLMDSYHLIIRRSFLENARELFPDAKLIVLEEKKWIRPTGRFSNFVSGHEYAMFQIPKIAKRENLDLMFYPFHDVSNNMNLPIPIVMTIHDLFHCNYPQFLSKKYLFYVKKRYPALIYKADSLIAISDFVKSDILKFFPKTRPEDIHRIYNSIVFDGNELEALSINKPFILSINSMRYHKNQITLVKAFNAVKNDIPHQLLLVGSRGEALPEIETYIKSKNLQDRVRILKDLSNGARNYLYKRADLFVSPSLHEGFGMTPVEAMLAETEVISTRETSLYESTMGLAHYYEPAADARQLAQAILHVLHSPQSPESLHSTSEKLKKAYDRLKIAQEYDACLKGILYEDRN